MGACGTGFLKILIKELDMNKIYLILALILSLSVAGAAQQQKRSGSSSVNGSASGSGSASSKTNVSRKKGNNGRTLSLDSATSIAGELQSSADHRVHFGDGS